MQDYFLFLQNHWELSAVLAAIVVLLIIFEFLKLRSGAGQLSPQQLTQLINHENAVIIDIRQPDSFLAGHIISAISMSAKELSGKSTKLEKYKSKPIVLVCANGQETGRLADTLIKQGYDVKTLSGGIKSWHEADMPIVKG